MPVSKEANRKIQKRTRKESPQSARRVCHAGLFKAFLKFVENKKHS